jgi:hypothetical protein
MMSMKPSIKLREYLGGKILVCTNYGTQRTLQLLGPTTHRFWIDLSFQGWSIIAPELDN